MIPPGGSDRRKTPRDSLQAYSRLLAIAAEQMEALENGNDSRVMEIAEERRRLEAELLLAEGPAESAITLHRELKSLLDSSGEELERRQRRLDEVRDFWLRMRGEALSWARNLRRRAPLPGRYGDPSAAERTLDVRL